MCVRVYIEVYVDEDQYVNEGMSMYDDSLKIN